MPGRGENVIAVSVSVEAVSMAEKEADGEVGRGGLGRYGDVAVEAVVDVGGFEEEVGETVAEVPDVEDASCRWHCRHAG